jgi:hypothetical protein
MKSLFVLLTLLLSFSTYAQEKGIGISLGNPTGLNGKYWLDGTHAVDGGLGMSLGEHTEVSIHSDYLFHNEGAFFFNDVHALDLYYGLGGRMEFSDDIEIGVRVPVGLVHKIENGPADVFGEVAPIVDFVTRKGIELHLLFGSRYYF